ncbi:unnamed protein product [Lota lota]
MGSRESRPGASQVVPVHSQDQDSEAQKPGEPQPQWTLPPLPMPAERRAAGQRARPPPQKRAETSLSTLSGNLKSVESNDRSILHSRPPKRPQVSGGRSGGIQRYSTPREEEHYGAISHTQEGFLRAQGALRQQAYQHRRAHHQRARGHRRTPKTVYQSEIPVSSNGDPSREGGRLVRRPTERDIFWGEYRGGEAQGSDLSSLAGEAVCFSQSLGGWVGSKGWVWVRGLRECGLLPDLKRSPFCGTETQVGPPRASRRPPLLEGHNS